MRKLITLQNILTAVIFILVVFAVCTLTAILAGDGFLFGLGAGLVINTLVAVLLYPVARISVEEYD